MAVVGGMSAGLQRKDPDGEVRSTILPSNGHLFGGTLGTLHGDREGVTGFQTCDLHTGTLPPMALVFSGGESCTMRRQPQMRSVQ